MASGTPAPMSVFGRQDGWPVVIGHRGAPREAPQNTFDGFVAAVAAGADWVELDVRRSRDDQVVVVHDPVTPDGVAVVERDAAALARLGVPRLADVLERLPRRVGVDVELKNLPGQPDFDETEVLAGLVADVLAASAPRPLLASSFNPATASAIAAATAVPAGLVTGAGTSLATGGEIAAELGLDVVCAHVRARGLDADTVAAVHARGLEVMVWVVDDEATARRLAAAGVDALCSDDPRRLVRALRADA